MEDESRRAFAGALPSAWVARSITPDYGIDVTVEIFNADGVPTGRSFHVQLKATDEPDLNRALGLVRFPAETVDYYRSLPLPVLIALYHAPSQQLFARWFHAYDPHVTARPRSEKGIATSMGFRFSENDVWTSDTPRQLDEGLRGFLAFHGSELPLPLALAVDIDLDRGLRLAFALRSVLTTVSDLVSVERRRAEANDPAVQLYGEGWRVTLADVASVTMDRADFGSPIAVASDVAVALAVALAKVGQANLAAQIGMAAASRSRVIADWDASFTLAGAMFQARRIREAIELADALDESADEEIRLAAAGFLMALLGARRMPESDRALAVAAAERRITRRVARGELAFAGAEAYSLAMLHKRQQQGQEAIAAFERALDLEPRYAERAYFHRDRGGVLFETKNYTAAVAAYAMAFELGERGLGEALYADALLFAGRYRDAETQLDRYLAEDRGPDAAEWRLKRQILPLLRARGGDSQHRLVDRAERLVESVDLTTATTVEAPKARLEAALATDSCNGEAWFRLFLLDVVCRQEIQPGRRIALAAAVLLRTAAGAWSNALVAAEASGAAEYELLDIMRVAYRYNGDEFVQIVMAERGLWERLGSLLERVAVETDDLERRRGFIVRFNSDDGEVREIVVGEN